MTCQVFISVDILYLEESPPNGTELSRAAEGGVGSNEVLARPTTSCPIMRLNQPYPATTQRLA